MTIGPRYHFKDSSYYGRLFFGKSSTVFFLDDTPDITRRRNASRLQYEGPVYGIAVGKFFERRKNSNWFIEGSLTYQSFERETGIRNDGDVPVETFNSRPTNAVNIYSIYAIIGVKVF